MAASSGSHGSTSAFDPKRQMCGNPFVPFCQWLIFNRGKIDNLGWCVKYLAKNVQNMLLLLGEEQTHRASKNAVK